MSFDVQNESLFELLDMRLKPQCSEFGDLDINAINKCVVE